MGNPCPKPQHLAPKLQAIRENFDLSQYRLAQLLQVGRTRLSAFEWGQRIPNLVTLLRYARLAGIPLESIVDDDVDLEAFRLQLAAADAKMRLARKLLKLPEKRL